MLTRMNRYARAMLIAFIACACEQPDAPLLVTADVYEPPAVLLDDLRQPK